MSGNDASAAFERKKRQIMRELDHELASADLEAASHLRLWSLLLLALLLGLAPLANADSFSLVDGVRILAVVAVASAIFHVATWTLLRVWLHIKWVVER